MNWRRGTLLAGIHLAVAVPLIVMIEARDEAYVREHAPRAEDAARAIGELALPQDEGEAVSFGPCDLMWGHPPAEQVLTKSANLPAMVFSGWRQDCPPHWSLAGRLNIGYSWSPSPSTIPARREICWWFGLMIVVQWFLVGGFPLRRPKNWWAEPGAFITCCAVIGCGLVLVRPIAELARLPALVAVLAWLWWFGLLVWKCVRFGWRRIAGRRIAAS